MKTINLTQNILRLAMLSWLALAAPIASRLQAQDRPAAPTQAELAKSLLGIWILVGKPGEVGEAPAKGGRLKVFTGRHWMITQADPETGVTVFHHGGTYTLEGDKYAETVEYANENTAELIKATHRFTLKIEGDTLTQTGVGNPWTEVWKRVK